MTVKFSRSVRSIQADNLVPVMVGIGFFILLMLGWIGWFFLAQIPTYATSTAAVYQREGFVIAQFDAATTERMRRGQAARFHVTTTRSNQSIPFIVTDVDPATNRVRLIPRTDSDTLLQLQAGTTGAVEVVIRQESPALFVLRAAGLWPEI
ncbi:MAG: hypothetical protein KF832_01585 [Caldilineaceae bacterium]|nr:hypothetical protein [Caldilineaceae bacterium]